MLIKKYIILGLIFSSSVFAKTESNIDWGDYVSIEKEMEIQGKLINYEAATGFINLLDKKNEVKAKVFFISYTKLNENSAKRPITFIFNGGPGSSSVWLHLGAFGPKIISLEDSLNVEVPPYELIENPHTLLATSDLVFIDPIGTGFSRTNGDLDSKEFFNVDGDIESIGEIIRDYLTTFNRWPSPKYLAGESYGTLRAVGLAEHFHQNLGIYLNGLILISSAIDFQTLQFPWGSDDLSYVLYLPSYTATALYHNRLSPEKQQDPEKTIEMSRQFAFEIYTNALLLGSSISEEQFENIAQRLSEFTGISSELIKECNLRIDEHTFIRNLLEDSFQSVGRFDSRYVGYVFDRKKEEHHLEDPSASSIEGVFTASLYDYLKNDLNCNFPSYPYQMLNIEVNNAWDYSKELSGYLNLRNSLKRALLFNPKMKVFCVGGKFDLATPFLSGWYTVNHLNIPNSVQKQISVKTYPGGHMLYLDKPILQTFNQDLQDWYAR